MKKTVMIAFLFGIVLYSQAGTPVASVVLSEPQVSNLLSLYITTSTTNAAYTLPVTYGGIACRKLPTGNYAYFNADATVIPPTQKNVVFNITFYDEGFDKVTLQYNAIGNSVNPLAFYKTGTNTWLTVKYAVKDANFTGSQNNSSDFRIIGTGANYFSQVTLDTIAMNPALEPVATVSASSYSELTGKSVAGYQAWFKTGNTSTNWVHWAKNSTLPAAGNAHTEVYPDVTDYDQTQLTQTGLAKLGNGTPSTFFHSCYTDVINTHFNWMKTYGIDGVAVQRFIGNIGWNILNSPGGNSAKIKTAAEATGRIFYICYDTSSSGFVGTWAEAIKFDWVYNVEQNNNLTASPAYAKVGNKPVVQLWGPGFKDNDCTVAEALDLIDFLQKRGCFVIGGTPAYWRDYGNDTRGPSNPAPNNEDYMPVYLKYNMISPWMAGRFTNIAGANTFLAHLQADKTKCDQNNIKYMPCIFPGFGWSNWNDGPPNSAPRAAGEFMWAQAKNIKKLGVSSMYFGMFDEYDEGTAIMKNATDWSTIPTDQYFQTTSIDGTWCSSDFQLRTAGAAIEMLKGTRAVTTSVPVPYSNGPVYYRNSFESRSTTYINKAISYTGTFNLDPCFYNNTLMMNSNVTNASTVIQQTNPRNGQSSVAFIGTVTSTSAAKYYYKIGDLKIAVKPNMKISFWKKTVNDLGQYCSVDFITKNNKTLRDNGYLDQSGASISPATPRGTVGGNYEQFICKFGSGVLLGDTITGIVVGYEHTGVGTFTAYFDDFQIDDLPDITAVNFPENPSILNVASQSLSNGKYHLKMPQSDNYNMQVFDISGKLLVSKNFNNSEDDLDISSYANGIYILSISTNNKRYTQKLVKL